MSRIKIDNGSNDPADWSRSLLLVAYREKEKEITELKEANRWRSVEDEPEEGEEFLIRVESGEIYIAYFDGINWSMRQKGLAVTHWRPLPVPAVEGGE